MAAILHTSQAETKSGTGSLTPSGGNILIGMFVNISDASGVLPTLIIQLQHSPNGTDWYNISGIVTGSLAGISLTPIIPATQQLMTENIRIVWTIGGVNPSFTFEVEVEAA